MDSVSSLINHDLTNMLSAKSKLIMNGEWSVEKLASVCEKIDEVNSIEISGYKDSILLNLNINHSNEFNCLNNSISHKISSAISKSFPLTGYSNIMTHLSILPKGNKAILYI